MAPFVPFTTSAAFTSVTVSFTNAPPGPNGSTVLLVANDTGSTSPITVAPGNTAATGTIGTNADWFGGTGGFGFEWVGAVVFNNSGNLSDWTPGVVTVRWCP